LLERYNNVAITLWSAAQKSIVLLAAALNGALVTFAFAVVCTDPGQTHHKQSAEDANFPTLTTGTSNASAAHMIELHAVTELRCLTVVCLCELHCATA
jgi:hypothetical protein